MGKKAPKAPAAPDYNQLIRTQADVNRVNTVSPFGTTAYVGPNRNTQVTQLSPELEGIFQQAVGQAGSPTSPGVFQSRALPAPVADVALNSPERTTGTGAFDFRSFDPSALDPSAIEGAFYDRQTRLLEPQFAQRERGLRQNLADRGLVEGSEAYTNALNMERDQQNRARQDAALSAVLAGREAFERDRAFDYGTFADERNFSRSGFESDRNFGFQGDMFDASRFDADRQLANILNQQDFGNRFALDEGDRSFFLNTGNQALNADQVQFQQLAALLGLSPQTPINPVDVTGPASIAQQGQALQYQGALNNYNQRKGGMTDIIGSGALLGAAALSDIRAKANLVKIGTTSKGFNVYRWDWKTPRPQRNEGVIAQEVQAVMPDAVIERNGLLHVDYRKVGTW